ncbi:hypothetical protein [Pseudonocardia sp. T1-2H]|uniref:hypothetical protein n=1 Tax=Pseudonocardia sp. T1-2H TaxID=3128899 RepID=UPI0031015288
MTLMTAATTSTTNATPAIAVTAIKAHPRIPWSWAGVEVVVVITESMSISMIIGLCAGGVHHPTGLMWISAKSYPTCRESGRHRPAPR